MNSLIDLLDQALQANLSKRQWAAFAAVLRQTVGFRKVEDDLSPRRLEQLTGIRRNHIWQAKKELEALGLLQSRPGHYGEILSFSPPIPPPLQPKTVQSAPETGQPAARIGTEPVPKQDTTLSNLTTNHHNTVVVDESLAVVSSEPEDSGLQYPPELSASERGKAPASLDGLSPQAAQQVLDVWACKIRRGEVRKSRLGLLSALVKAQRQDGLDIRCLSQKNQVPPPPDKPMPQQQQLAHEHWLERQVQQAWLRDMQHFGVAMSDLKPPEYCRSGGAG